MPKLNGRLPAYRLHKRSGQAVVTIDGWDIYLGKHGSRESKTKYSEVITAHAKHEPVAPLQDKTYGATGPTVASVVAEFLRYAKTHFVKNGENTGEYRTFKRICKEIVSDPIHANLPAAKYSQHELRELRQIWIDRGVARQGVSKYTSKVKRVFRWAAARELIPDAVMTSLNKLECLTKHEFGLRETQNIEPVDDDVLKKTLPHLTPTLSAMVWFQLYTGARPGEVVKLRPGMLIDEGNGVEFRVADHKVDKKSTGGDSREFISINDEAMDAIRPYLDRPDNVPCFSMARHASELPESKRKFISDSRKFPDRFTTKDYYNAIQRAVVELFPVPAGLDEDATRAWKRKYHWTPNQLRHNAGTFAYDMGAILMVAANIPMPAYPPLDRVVVESSSRGDSRSTLSGGI